MKQTCNKCRALRNFRCLLGFKIKVLTSDYHGGIERKPSEQCPKPKTMWQMNEAVVEMAEKRDEVKK